MAGMETLTKPLHRARQETLRTTTLREFTGGLNVVDNPYNMVPEYATQLDNMHRTISGDIAVRYGTALLADTRTIRTGDIIGTYFYANRVIAVDTNGVITATDGTGTSNVIWDDVIASTIYNTNGWSATTFVSFTVFRGRLLIANGSDKPLMIDNNLTVTYLRDLASDSNINTPVGRYILGFDRYVIVAGDPVYPDRLHIGNIDSIGTFYNDVAPNDAVYLDLGSYAPTTNNIIRGIGAFRDKLVVVFDNVLLIGTLGIYVDGVHTPDFSDIINQYGTISHRSIQSLPEDMYFCDGTGVPSIARALFTTTIQPKRVSQLVDPLIQADLSKMPTTAALSDGVFSVLNPNEGQYMLFIPNGATPATTTERICYVYTVNSELKVKAWARFRNWNWTAACTTELNRVIFAKGTQLFLYGNQREPYERDFINNQETFSDGTIFSDRTGFTPISAGNSGGLPIKFDWRWPWADFDRHMHVKRSKFVSFDTSGTGAFTLDMFIDGQDYSGIYQGDAFGDNTLFSDGFGWYEEENHLAPVLTCDFVGGEQPGYGLDNYGQLYGGGRVTNTPLLYTWPAKFKLARMRIHGDTLKKLSFTAISIAYSDGSIRRQ